MAQNSVLTVDVGNTTTNLGFFEGEKLVGSFELTTPERLTADEAYLAATDALAAMGIGAGAGADAEKPAGAILACVVPALADVWAAALARTAATRPLVVGPGLRTGLQMHYDDPSELGADRVADAVEARAAYGAPVVVVDLGTTTNFEVVDAAGAFAGGIIAPGVALGARALADAAARLPQVPLHAPEHVVGKNTRAAIQSGVVLGEAARIDGLLLAIERELGSEVPVVLTGTDAEAVAALLAHATTVDATLTLRGLRRIWAHNQR